LENRETPTWKKGRGPIGSQLGKGPIESGMSQMRVTPFQAMYQFKGLSREARGDWASEEKDKHLLQAAWTPAPPVPK